MFTFQDPDEVSQQARAGCSLLAQAWHSFERGLKACEVGLIYAAMLAIALMVGIQTVDIIGGKLANTPLPGMYESTEALLIVILFCGLAYTQAMNRHISVEILSSRFPLKVQSILSFIGFILGFSFFGLLTWRCSLYFWQSWLVKEYTPSLVRFPIYPVKFVLTLAVGLMTLRLLVDSIRAAIALLCGSSKSIS